MSLETIILCKLTQEQKMKYRIFSLRWVMKNENTWTQGREYQTLGSIGRKRGGTVVGGTWGGIAWGEMPNVGEGEKGSKTHCHVCTYANVLHVLHMYPKT